MKYPPEQLFVLQDVLLDDQPTTAVVPATKAHVEAYYRAVVGSEGPVVVLVGQEAQYYQALRNIQVNAHLE